MITLKLEVLDERKEVLNIYLPTAPPVAGIVPKESTRTPISCSYKIYFFLPVSGRTRRILRLLPRVQLLEERNNAI